MRIHVDTGVNTDNPVSVELDDYQLEDRFKRTEGRVYLTGTQALVAILFMQKRLDEAAGLNTAGFVTGYRGSPLGAVDQTLWANQALLEESDIRFMPAVNEDLAATAILGTQQVETEQQRTVDGVYAMWYGKGCGVDRSGDAMKHGNAYGSSAHGGVLAIAGDDHGSVSSTMSHQSDIAFMSWYMPTLHPSRLDEYIEFGRWGYAASRYSGLWMGFKAISERVESAGSVELPPLPTFHTPTDIDLPADGLNLRYPDLPGMQIEGRMEHKIAAVRAFARANPIDKWVYRSEGARFGIVTSGKAHLDVMEALMQLGIDRAEAGRLGIDVYKVGMVWPLENQGAEQFADGKQEVLVIEEKRGIIEAQLKEHLYSNSVNRPETIVGKLDEVGNALVPAVMELAPSLLAPIVATRLQRVFPELDLSDAMARLAGCVQSVQTPEGVRRTPYFCSGCPHNTSTRVPEGSKAMGGTGCHFMAAWMDRSISDHIMQMGGEGVNWVAKSNYLEDNHIFQNIGDGTYFHSGTMAIRQAVAAGTNITYKVLYNDAVAMTGGQPVEGGLTVPQIASQVLAEGVHEVVVVSDDVARTRGYGGYPGAVDFHHRENLDSVQRQLRETPGVTVLIYDQTCAAEKRRRRKRGEYPDPARRVVINDLVCEGCGDCSLQSNCLSILPKETEFGRKRAIDQSSCNKDYSCVNGFCPSFVTVEGGQLKKAGGTSRSGALEHAFAALPYPALPEIDHSSDLLIGGIGGTGVVTIGAIVAMAAHLEGKGASVQDYMGIAQKGGSVFSYVRLANDPDSLNQMRIDAGGADTVILCDLVVGNDPRALRVMRNGVTRAIANSATIPTAAFLKDRSVDFQTRRLMKTVRDACGEAQVSEVNANALALEHLGDLVYSNMLLLGMAWQQGRVPISLAAIDRAVELNGRAVDQNKRAFAVGRIAAHRPELLRRDAVEVVEVKAEMLDAVVERRAEFLIQYQNAAYAQRYRNFLASVTDAASIVDASQSFALAVARNLFKLMAYKDEYEIARLHTDGSFKAQVEAQFEGDYTLKFNLAPPVLKRGQDEQGRPRKTEFGGWMYQAFRLLAPLKVLRGTALDLFGYTAERRTERQLIADYRDMIEGLVPQITPDNLDIAVQLAELPDGIRGFGPVKENSIQEVTERQAQLMSEFKTSGNRSEAA